MSTRPEPSASEAGKPAAPNESSPRRRRFELPDTFILIFLIVLAAAATTYFVPAGVFDTRVIEYNQGDQVKTRTVLAPESFRLAKDENGEPLHQTVALFVAGTGPDAVRMLPDDARSERGVLNYLFDGLTSGDRNGTAVGIVTFILIIGGSFGIILRTGAIEAGIRWILLRMTGAEVWCLPVLFILFSLGGAIFGMGAEAIALAMIVVPMVIRMGYDSITGVMITYGATQVGFATSWMNPFSVAVAQGMAGVPVLSGAGFRFGMWVFFNALAIGYVIWHARRVKACPERSPSFETDGWFRARAAEEDAVTPAAGAGARSNGGFGYGERVVVAVFVLGLAWVVWGVTFRGYYIGEIATQFFATGAACGVAAVIFRVRGMTLNSLADGFRDGASQLVGAALVVGMAKGIVLILGGDGPTEPGVLNTFLHNAGEAMSGLAAPVSAGAMYAFQSAFNFFVPSGSGQAALTMPIMAPLADLTGLSRQVAVLAFQLGDGLTNLLIPTSAALMGTLTVARIPWTTWIRFQWKLQAVFFIAGYSVLLLAIAIGF
jgi:uncharacterized ion transporter superfamily protein YfcC